MQSIEDISKSIRQFIETHFPLARNKSLVDDESLLDNGIIDSMGVLEVVEFIETEFKINLTDEEMLANNFESISTLTIFVRAKLDDTPELSL